MFRKYLNDRRPSSVFENLQTITWGLTEAISSSKNVCFIKRILVNNQKILKLIQGSKSNNGGISIRMVNLSGPSVIRPLSHEVKSITHKIVFAFDANPSLEVCGIFLDLAKAFGRV